MEQPIVAGASKVWPDCRRFQKREISYRSWERCCPTGTSSGRDEAGGDATCIHQGRPSWLGFGRGLRLGRSVRFSPSPRFDSTPLESHSSPFSLHFFLLLIFFSFFVI